MLELYGNPRSRAMRCLWMLEEIGVPYRLIEKSTSADDLQIPEYLRLNPNARIPTLVDGSFVLWESMAINLYLAQKYEGPMHCTEAEVLGLSAQWSFWAMSEMEHLLLDLPQHRALLPEFARDPSYAERAQLLLNKPLEVLNNSLAGRKYLVCAEGHDGNWDSRREREQLFRRMINLLAVSQRNSTVGAQGNSALVHHGHLAGHAISSSFERCD
jgi:glutathione S-transferase